MRRYISTTVMIASGLVTLTYNKPLALSKPPERFIIGAEGDISLAEKRWQCTLTWRKEYHTKDLLLQSCPHFHAIKKIYGHYIHRRDFLNNIIVIEQCKHPSKLLKKLKEQGILVDDIVRHQVFIMEFMWRHLCKDYDEEDFKPICQSKMLKIIDLEGFGFQDFLSFEVYDYFKKLSEIGVYYPERVYKVVIINAPSWFGAIWKIAGPLVPKRTAERLEVYGNKKEYRPILAQMIGMKNLPKEYGGYDPCSLGQSPEEQQLRELVTRLNARAI